MSELRLCDGCERHIRVSEARCPFCDRACSADPPRRSAASMLFAVAAAATVAACYGGPQRNVAPPSQPVQEQPSSSAPAPSAAPAPAQTSDAAATNGHARSIGEARMLADRTIELELSDEGARDSVGAGTFRYPAAHPQYDEILAHVGPMQPGQRRSVRAF